MLACQVRLFAESYRLSAVPDLTETSEVRVIGLPLFPLRPGLGGLIDLPDILIALSVAREHPHLRRQPYPEFKAPHRYKLEHAVILGPKFSRL